MIDAWKLDKALRKPKELQEKCVGELKEYLNVDVESIKFIADNALEIHAYDRIIYKQLDELEDLGFVLDSFEILTDVCFCANNNDGQRKIYDYSFDINVGDD